jgi:hypothetical protein
MYQFERPPHLVYPDISAVRSEPVHRLHAYWRMKAPQGRPPSRSSIEPADIRALLPHLLLAELAADPFRIFYRLVGTAVARSHKDDFTGRSHDSVESLRNSGIEGAYRRAMDQAAPVFGSAGIVAGDHSWIPFEYGIMPLSDDGLRVNKCLAIECTGELPPQPHMARIAAPVPHG